MEEIKRFFLIGIGGAIVDYGTRWILLSLGVLPTLSRAGSYIAGSTFAYILNSKFTFNGNRSRTEIIRASIVYSLCFTLAVIVDWACRSAYTGAYYLQISWVVSQGVATVVNFLLQKLWVFK